MIIKRPPQCRKSTGLILKLAGLGDYTPRGEMNPCFAVSVPLLVDVRTAALRGLGQTEKCSSGLREHVLWRAESLPVFTPIKHYTSRLTPLWFTGVLNHKITFKCYIRTDCLCVQDKSCTKFLSDAGLSISRSEQFIILERPLRIQVTEEQKETPSAVKALSWSF